MPRPTKSERERRNLIATAYHEAGHAVMSVRKNQDFEHVTIESDEDSLGHVQMAQLSDSFLYDLGTGPEDESKINDQVLVSMSWMAAERRLVGRQSCRGAKNDRR